ncbi:flavin reductase [Rathayibacter sp. VKM Ac-2630]|uniref:flavin reductase n=1 Tax=Rathayibacter sp. VKM Ac-2630 TaxID=1938617 RepID=UPI0009825B59
MTVLATAAPPLQRDLDLETLRAAFGLHPSGVAALIAQVDGIPVVLVASSFTVGVSADPPLVSVAVQRTSTSWPLLRRARSIGARSCSTTPVSTPSPPPSRPRDDLTLPQVSRLTMES